MAVKIKTIAESVSDNGIKAVIHAPAGTGKTVLCATAGEKTVIISAEAGLLSLMQDPDYLRGQGSPDFDPSCCDVIEVKSVQDLSDAYDYLCEDKVNSDGFVVSRKRLTDYVWVCLDSLTEIAEQVLAREMKLSADPRKSYPAMQAKVLELIKSFRDMPGYNVIMTSKQEKSKDEESGLNQYTVMMPGNKVGPQIPYLFDEVWALRIGVDEEKNRFHYVQCVRDHQYDCKDRSGKLTDCEPPSLKKLKAKIKGEAVKRSLMQPVVMAEETSEAEEAEDQANDE